MKAANCHKLLGVFLSLLIITLPICFADSIDLITDNNGNLITGDGFYRQYNSLNQLWKVYNGSNSSGMLLQEYTYDPVEERVLIKKSYNSSGQVFETVYYIFDDYIEVVNSTGTYGFTYIKHEGQLIAEKKPDGTKQFYHPDHHGSTTLITDESGNIVEETFYTPHGSVISGGEQSRYDYTGQEYDSVVKQYDYNARMRLDNPPIFVQPDTLLPNLYNPQECNRYSYVNNNPYRYTDESGHCPVCLLMLFAFGFGAGYYIGTHPGSGVDQVGHTYAAGTIAAGSVWGSYAFATGVGTAAGTASATMD